MSFTKLKLEPTDPEAIRRWFPPLILSVVILLAGAAWTWRIGKESNGLDHHLSHVREALDDLKTYVKLREASQK
jgi:hypothetical protein